METITNHPQKTCSNADSNNPVVAMEPSVIPDVNTDIAELENELSGEGMHEIVQRLLDVHNEYDAMTEERYLEKEQAEHQFLVNRYFIFIVNA